MNRTYNVLRDEIIRTFDTQVINIESHGRMMIELDKHIAAREAQHACAFMSGRDDIEVSSCAITAEAFRQERSALSLQ